MKAQYVPQKVIISSAPPKIFNSGLTLHTMRKEDGVFLLRNADSTWTVEVTQTGLVRTWNSGEDWTDFYTWQCANQSRLMCAEPD